MRARIEELEGRQLLSFGDLDSTFANGGRAILPAGAPAGAHDSAADLLRLRDGRIAVSDDAGIAVYKTDGSLDPSFSGDGFLPSSSASALHLMAQASNDSVLVVDGNDSNQQVLRSF